MADIKDKNKIENSRLIKRRIFNLEEWSRINKNLERLEKMRKNDSGMAKTTISLIPRRMVKNNEAMDEDWNGKKEVLPEMNATGKTLTSDKAKEEIILAAKKILFENKDFARRILHGLRLSSVLHERNKQIDFNRRLRNMMEGMRKEIKLKMTEEVKNYNEEIKRDKWRKKEISDMLRKELDRQICQKIEGRLKEEAEKVREGNEIVKMNEELRLIVEKEQQEADMKKEKLKKDIENYMKSEMEIRRKWQRKEEEQEEKNKIYQMVAWEIDKRRRDKEKVSFGRMTKFDKEIFRDGKENLKMRSDGDKQLKSFLLMREARKKALLKDLLIGKRMAEEEGERRRNEEKLERRRAAMERLRKVEGDRLRSVKEKEECRRVQRQWRNCYLLQARERQELEREEKEMDNLFAADFAEENRMISEYCDEVVELVKRSKRPVFPVVAAVRDVKKEFGIETVKNANFLKSNVPINN